MNDKSPQSKGASKPASERRAYLYKGVGETVGVVIETGVP